MILTIKLPQLIREHQFAPVTMPERMEWTSSSIKLFRKCKRKFFWKYIMRLRPRVKAGSLMIGSAFHEAIAEWYRSRRSSMTLIAVKHVNKVRAEAEANQEFYGEEDWDQLSSNVQTLTGMLRGYADVYEHDRRDWRIDRKNIELPFKVNMGDFDYSGKIDLVAQEGKENDDFIVEHKTAKKIGDSYVERLPMDTQCRTYIFGAIKGHGLKPKKVLYDVVRKCALRRKANETAEAFNERIATDYMARPDFYFFREPLMFSKSDIDALEFEIRQTHKEFLHVCSQGNPLDPRTWTPNDSTCSEYFRTCEYMGLCTTGLDRGTGMIFEQGDELHEELIDEA